MAVLTKAQLKAIYANAETIEEQDTIDLIDSLAHVNDERFGTAVDLASDVPTSSATLVDVTGLGVAIDADSDYRVEFELICSSTSGTGTGIWIALNGPASPDAVAGRVMTQNSAGNSALSFHHNGYDQNSAFPNSAPSPFLVQGTFIVKNGANAGTLIPRMASETGGNTVTALAGSTMKVTKLN